jgi:hypothetical protein
MVLIHNSKEGTISCLQAEIMHTLRAVLSFKAQQLHSGLTTDDSLPLRFVARNFSKANRAYLRKECTFIKRKKNRKETKSRRLANIWLLTLFMLSHLVTQLAWYTCLHGRVICKFPLLYSIWQITHLSPKGKSCS